MVQGLCIRYMSMAQCIVSDSSVFCFCVFLWLSRRNPHALLGTPGILRNIVSLNVLVHTCVCVGGGGGGDGVCVWGGGGKEVVACVWSYRKIPTHRPFPFLSTKFLYSGWLYFCFRSVWVTNQILFLAVFILEASSCRRFTTPTLVHVKVDVAGWHIAHRGNGSKVEGSMVFVGWAIARWQAGLDPLKALPPPPPPPSTVRTLKYSTLPVGTVSGFFRSFFCQNIIFFKSG